MADEAGNSACALAAYITAEAGTYACESAIADVWRKLAKHEPTLPFLEDEQEAFTIAAQSAGVIPGRSKRSGGADGASADLVRDRMRASYQRWASAGVTCDEKSSINKLGCPPVICSSTDCVPDVTFGAEHQGHTDGVGIRGVQVVLYDGIHGNAARV